MTIKEVSNLISRPIEVNEWRTGKEKYQAQIKELETYAKHIYTSPWGCGATPKDALRDLCERLSNKMLSIGYLPKQTQYNFERITVTLGKITKSDYVLIKRRK